MAHPGSPTPPRASSLTLAQLGPKEGLPSRAEAELTTHDAGGDEVPPVVADRAPPAVHEHLHPALTHLGPRAEAHPRLLLGENLASGRAEEAGVGATPPAEPPQDRQSQGLEF